MAPAFTLLFLPVQPVDEAAAVDFGEGAGIDEIRRLALRVAGLLLCQVIDDRLNRAFDCVRFGGHVGSVIPGLVEGVPILRAEKFAQDPHSILAPGLEKMHAPNDGAHGPQRQVGIAFNK